MLHSTFDSLLFLSLPLSFPFSSVFFLSVFQSWLQILELSLSGTSEAVLGIAQFSQGAVRAKKATDPFSAIMWIGWLSTLIWKLTVLLFTPVALTLSLSCHTHIHTHTVTLTLLARACTHTPRCCSQSPGSSLSSVKGFHFPEPAGPLRPCEHKHPGQAGERVLPPSPGPEAGAGRGGVPHSISFRTSVKWQLGTGWDGQTPTWEIREGFRGTGLGGVPPLHHTSELWRALDLKLGAQPPLGPTYTLTAGEDYSSVWTIP